MKRALLFLLITTLVLAFAVTAHPTIHFDPAQEEPFMDCAFNGTSTGQCLTGNWTVNATELEAANYNASGSWCGNRSYYSFDGVDSVNYDMPASFQNLTNVTIIVGFTPNNVTKFAGIVSYFSEDLMGGGWTIRTLDTGYLQFRHVNATNDTSHTFNDNGHTGLQNNVNYTLVIKLDGTYMRAWLNNIQIERQNIRYPITSNATAKLRLGYYNSTSVNRFTGQIHFVYIYNYSLTDIQAANRTQTICGTDQHPINSTRYGSWPLTTHTGPDWSNLSSYDQFRDAYDYRPFDDHSSGIDFHRGVDLANLSGIPEYAVLNGTVVRAETDEEVNSTGRRRFGNWVMIEHSPDPDTGQPRHTLYFHMNDTPLVTEGDNVTGGATLLGYSGKTGYQINSNHLHFELARDLDEDKYTQRRVIHPTRILNYTNTNATTIFITANTTHYTVMVTHNYTDMDFVAIKIVGSAANRTINYETKEGLNESDADQHCYNYICFEPGPSVSPFANYTVNYSIVRTYSGPLVGAIIQDAQGETEVYEITSWTNPNITITKLAPSNVSTSGFVNYSIRVNITGDAAFNITLSDHLPPSLRYHNSTTNVTGANDTYLLGNLTAGIYYVNITAQALNVSNGTIANNTANVTYYNFTGTFSSSNSTTATTIFGIPTFTNLTITKGEDSDPVSTNFFFVYSITLNITNGTAYNVIVSDVLPPEVRYSSATPAPTSGNDTFALGNLTQGTIYAINITAQLGNITNGIIFNNTANVSFDNATGSTFTRNITINTTALSNAIAPNLTITKTESTDPANISGVFNYTILINITNGTAYNVTVSDNLSDSVRYSSATPSPVSGTNNTFIIGNATAGETFAINITVILNNVSNQTVFNNTANVTFANSTGFTYSLNTTINTTAVLVPDVPFVNLSITKTASAASVDVGDSFVYRILINVTNGTPYNITVMDEYPAGTIYSSASPSPVDGTNNTFNLGNLSYASSYMINITVTLNEAIDGANLTNTANVTFFNETGYQRVHSSTVNITAVNAAEESDNAGSTGGGGGGSGIPCANECTPQGFLYCTGYSQVQCGYYDTDACLDLKTSACPAGNNCVPGTGCVCTEEWDCSEWTRCADGIQTRTCKPVNGCVNAEAPAESKTCTITENPSPTIEVTTPTQPQTTFKLNKELTAKIITAAALLTLLTTYIIRKRNAWLAGRYFIRNEI